VISHRRGFLSGTATAAAALAAISSPAAAETDPPVRVRRPIPSAVQPVTVYNLRELEARSEQVLSKGTFDYIAGASGDEWTHAENQAALKRITLAPHYLSGVGSADLSTTLLGAKVAAPFFIAPMGTYGMVHATAEVGAAQAAAAEGILMCPSTYSTSTLEAIAAAGASPKWFQVYLPADRGVARELLMRAKAAGYLAMAVTIDVDVRGNHERDDRNHYPGPGELLPMGNFAVRSQSTKKPDLNWDDIEFVQKVTGLPVFIKGVLGADLVKQARKAGLAGVYVSNHGGRQLDDTPASTTVLPRIVDAADGKLTVVVDSGFRRGQDVFKALALGANAVGIGRPILYGLSLGGPMGVQATLARLKAELEMTMRLMGTRTVAEIGRKHLYT
jgi:lactate oxidase